MDPFVEVPEPRLAAVTLGWSANEHGYLVDDLRALHGGSAIVAPSIDRLADLLRRPDEPSSADVMTALSEIADTPDVPSPVLATLLHVIGWADRTYGFVDVRQLPLFDESQLPPHIRVLRGLLPRLLPFLDNSDREVRYAAGWAVGRAMDPRAVPALTMRLEAESESLVRRSLVHALVYSGGIACRSLLESRLTDPDFGTRFAAAESLKWLLSPVAPPATALVAMEAMYEVFENEDPVPEPDRIFWTTDRRPWSHLYMLAGPENFSLRPYETTATVRVLLDRLPDVPTDRFQVYAAQIARALFPFTRPAFTSAGDDLVPQTDPFAHRTPPGRPFRLTGLQDRALEVILAEAKRKGVFEPLDHFDSHMYVHYLPVERTELAEWLRQCRELRHAVCSTGGHPDPVRLLTPAAPPDPEWPGPDCDLTLHDRIAQRLSRRTLAVFILIAVDEALRVLQQCEATADWAWARVRLANAWRRFEDPAVPGRRGESPMTPPDAEIVRRVFDFDIERGLTILGEPDFGYRGFRSEVRFLAEAVARAQGPGEPMDLRSHRIVAFVDWCWRRCLGRLAFVDAPAGRWEMMLPSPLVEPDETPEHAALVGQWRDGRRFRTVADLEDPVTLRSGRTIPRARLSAASTAAV